jgi:hypothetical protein
MFAGLTSLRTVPLACVASSVSEISVRNFNASASFIGARRTRGFWTCSAPLPGRVTSELRVRTKPSGGGRAAR